MQTAPPSPRHRFHVKVCFRQHATTRQKDPKPRPNTCTAAPLSQYNAGRGPRQRTSSAPASPAAHAWLLTRQQPHRQGLIPHTRTATAAQHVCCAKCPAHCTQLSHVLCANSNCRLGRRSRSAQRLVSRPNAAPAAAAHLSERPITADTRPTDTLLPHQLHLQLWPRKASTGHARQLRQPCSGLHCTPAVRARCFY